MKVELFYQTRNGGWESAGIVDPVRGAKFKNADISLRFTCFPAGEETGYELEFSARYPTRAKIAGSLDGGEAWHLIPCCIHGDNNLANAKPGQYPNLTREYPEAIYSSPVWEFRADRASHPVSIAVTARGEVGAISIDPYCRDGERHLVRNGLFAELPDRFGVTVGYANLPFTFVNKYCDHDDGRSKSTSQPVTGAKCSGKLFHFRDGCRDRVRTIIESLYRHYRECPKFEKSFEEAARAVLTAFVEQNWSDAFNHYTDQEAHPPRQPELKPWRALLEIGWTGGSILAYPFITAMDVLKLPEKFFRGRKSGYDLFNEILDGYNPASGMFYDLVRELRGSRVNGWWDFLKITHDRHSAYTNGHALYYLFLTLTHLKRHNRPIPAGWLERAIEVADNHVALQREDGCCGYAFHTDRREVSDWNGFAGCWIGAALAAAGAFTGESRYRDAARKAALFYHKPVREQNVCGTPMDTWKAPDQEGNLAFMKLVRMLHEETGEPLMLQMLEDGAHYEYLWRYGFRAVPEIMPLAGSGWNSCGGSVTSVSNPHIHPMGVLVMPELFYLAERTGNELHRMRAEDGMAWIMNCLELYPEITGYGRYGVTTERYCPSDGLTDFCYSDGRPSSLWYSYNGWAAANTLEALLWMVANPR
ncbi:hypothetical protein [uncultured Victivallis sp.]|uniref:hypothetical protein n=1 Tax=uncultured Victivallis sp. TaxID=354118 RepID=UPI0025F0D874|nr:hypothetical protein [uncultured Victivallis sp.]